MPTDACLRRGEKTGRVSRTRRAAIGLLTATLGLVPAGGRADEEKRRSRTFELTYKATVRDIPAGAKALDLWLPLPQTDRNQVVHRLTIDAPNPVSIGREARFGNQCLHVRVEAPEAPSPSRSPSWRPATRTPGATNP